MDYGYPDIAGMIDHSLLNPALTEADLDAGCRLAVAYGVASVCILPYYLSRAVALLAGSPVRPSTTIGFPHGGHATAVKAAEARQAVSDGAQELDMVVNISQVMSGRWDAIRADIRAVIDIAHAAGRRVKESRGRPGRAHRVGSLRRRGASDLRGARSNGCGVGCVAAARADRRALGPRAHLRG